MRLLYIAVFLIILIGSNIISYKISDYKFQNITEKNQHKQIEQNSPSEPITKNGENEVNSESVIKSNIEKDNYYVDLENKITCIELVKKTPQTGNMRYIGIDIMGYYNDAKEHYDLVQKGEYRRQDDKEDNLAEKETAIREYNEAKTLFDEYSRRCQ